MHRSSGLSKPASRHTKVHSDQKVKTIPEHFHSCCLWEKPVKQEVSDGGVDAPSYHCKLTLSSAVSPLSQQRTVTPLGVEVILSCVQLTQSVRRVGDALSLGRPVSNVGCDIRCDCIFLALLSVLLRGEKICPVRHWQSKLAESLKGAARHLILQAQQQQHQQAKCVDMEHSGLRGQSD